MRTLRVGVALCAVSTPLPAEDRTVDATLHVEHHATDYAVVDHVSGRNGTIRSQTPWGASVGVSYRF